MRWDKDVDVLLTALREGIDKDITDLSVWNNGQPDKFTKTWWNTAVPQPAGV